LPCWLEKAAINAAESNSLQLAILIQLAGTFVGKWAAAPVGGASPARIVQCNALAVPYMANQSPGAHDSDHENR
jgi:hypothetical protein